MINRHLSSVVCLHAGLWKPMASHFRWIELLLRALSHRKYLRFFSLYNPKRCRFQLCRRLTGVRGSWPAVEIWSQHFKHRQLRFGEWYLQTHAVSRSATTTLEPLPLGRCLGLPGLLGKADWESWAVGMDRHEHGTHKTIWGGKWRESSVVVKMERNPNKQSILKDWKASVGNKNEFEKVSTEKTEIKAEQKC